MKLENNKVEAMILCSAFWDSLWIPVEMQTQEQIWDILEKNNISWKKVTSFLPPQTHKLYREGEYNPEATVVSSDDTFCTRATMSSLTENNSVNLQDMMERNLSFYRENDFGYGWTTRNAYEEFSKWKDISETGSNGWWNGVVMKLAPLTAYMLTKEYKAMGILDTLKDFTQLTHTHNEVIIWSYIHHVFLEYLLQNDSLENLDEELEEMILLCEQEAIQYDSFSLLTTIKKIQELFLSWKIYHLNDEEILEIFWWGDSKITASSGRIDITLWICYALFLRNHGETGIIDAVSIGWDTDTYGSIVWGMIWAFTWVLPREKDLSQIPEIEIIKQETHDFIELLNDI